MAELPDEQREIVVLQGAEQAAILGNRQASRDLHQHRDEPLPDGSGQAPFNSEWGVGIMTDRKRHKTHGPKRIWGALADPRRRPVDEKAWPLAPTAMHKAKPPSGSREPFDLENDHDKQSRQTDRGGRCRRRGVVRSCRQLHQSRLGHRTRRSRRSRNTGPST